jgi:putative FmdB family regulatory protein
MSYYLAVDGRECQRRAEEEPVPTYQYACTACDERLEVVQKFSDDPLTECAECGGRLRKVFSPVGIVFKGSGFYRTDSRNGSVNGAGKDAKQSGSDAKSDTKADASSGGDSPKTGGDSTSEKSGAKADSKAAPAKSSTKAA